MRSLFPPATITFDFRQKNLTFFSILFPSAFFFFLTLEFPPEQEEKRKGLKGGNEWHFDKILIPVKIVFPLKTETLLFFFLNPSLPLTTPTNCWLVKPLENQLNYFTQCLALIEKHLRPAPWKRFLLQFFFFYVINNKNNFINYNRYDYVMRKKERRISLCKKGL